MLGCMSALKYVAHACYRVDARALYSFCFVPPSTNVKNPHTRAEVDSN